ncbi:hypothetical protein [Estrella lausannensis]|uniref:Phage protein n=1 Tax=Estrella lausannensis TaxID=483423 RepID=A0A0H5E3M2_9BACT|nr:hypothetical protein [Estrella lausannensis]CRX37815.1 hypothetical protein ELAC_0460 [Estrella lausannensis]
MNKVELLKKIAQLESINDHLQTEINYVDQLMRMAGFQGGIETVKLAAMEIVKQAQSEG